MGKSRFLIKMMLICACMTLAGCQKNGNDNNTGMPEDVSGGPKEITLAMASVDACMKLAVSEFNRKNGEYQIVLETPQKGEDYSDFRTRVQLEMTNGEGPDIVSTSVLLDYREYVRRGLLEPLSDVLENPSDYIPATLVAGKYRQETYGIPYQCHVVIVAWRKSEVGERESLTLRDLTEIMRGTSKPILAVDGWGANLTGSEVISNYVLRDRANKEFIDWENGVSHLNESAFVELLEFMKGYVAKEGQGVAREDALSVKCSVTQRSDLNFIKAYFHGDEVILGYPSLSGGRNVVLSYLLFISANSQNKEAAKEFLRYVQSEEYQKGLADYGVPMEVGVNAVMPFLPVRWTAMRAWLDHERDPHVTATHTRNGVEYVDVDLTDQQKESFLAALEKADSSEIGTTQVAEIIEEELTPFFKGEKSAEEAANVLHHRIQLYLNEDHD